MREMRQRPETQTHWKKPSVYHVYIEKPMEKQRSEMQNNVLFEWPRILYRMCFVFLTTFNTENNLLFFLYI